MIFKSPKTKTPIPNLTIYEFLFEGNNMIEDEKPCFVDAKNSSQVITYRELKELILKFGAGLKRVSGFTQGDVIAIYSPNNIYYPAVLHGAVASGSSIAAVDHICDSETAAECLETVRAKIIIAHPETQVRAQEATKIVGISTKNIFILSQNEDIDGIGKFAH